MSTAADAIADYRAARSGSFAVFTAGHATRPTFDGMSTDELDDIAQTDFPGLQVDFTGDMFEGDRSDFSQEMRAGEEGEL